MHKMSLSPFSSAASLATSGSAGAILGLKGLPVMGKRVLLRADLNIPLNSRGQLIDDWRIKAIVPTIKTLLSQGARVGVLTHLGRPGGRVVPRLTTKPLAEKLAEVLGQPVEFVPDCVGRMAEYAMEKLLPGHILMFENARFYSGETLNQAAFAHQLSLLGDVYVNDAFPTAHRSHASTVGLPQVMERKAAGLLIQQEIEWAHRVLHPVGGGEVVAILAGSLVSPKLELMRGLLGRVNTIVLGGAVANTFLAARDLGLGHSLLEPNLVGSARELMAEAGVLGCRIHLPQDVVIADFASPKMAAGHKSVQELDANDVANDIGPQTITTWTRVLSEAASIVWFGGLGLMEVPDFAAGSIEIAKGLMHHNVFSLVAGDGLIRMLGQEGLRDKMPAVSSSSAALMMLLQNQPLPAVEVLKSRAV